MAEHPEVPSGYSVPECYVKNCEFVKYALFDATPLASALYYIAGCADFKRDLDRRKISRFLSDRSIWSTLAAAYSKSPGVLVSLINSVSSLAETLAIPEKLVVLKATFDVCASRIAHKRTGSEFDKDSRLAFNRKYELYDVIAEAGYDVHFICTDGKSSNEVYSEFCSLKIWD